MEGMEDQKVEDIISADLCVCLSVYIYCQDSKPDKEQKTVLAN